MSYGDIEPTGSPREIERQDDDLDGMTAEVERGYRERHHDEPTGWQHVQYEIDGLPDGGLPPGSYEMRFSGMVEHPVAGPPTIRFRYVGPAQQAAPAAGQAEAEDWLPPHPGVMTVRKYAGGAQYRTRTGKIITDEMIEAWAAEAEAGYEIDTLRVPPPPETELRSGPGMMPDLYQFSSFPQTETLNVSKLARVIAELLRTKAISPSAIGLSMKPSEAGNPWAELVEQWLRS